MASSNSLFANKVALVSKHGPPHSGLTLFPQNAHKDLIHDVAFDFYGTRLVSCGSDRTLKVWDSVEDSSFSLHKQPPTSSSSSPSSTSANKHSSSSNLQAQQPHQQRHKHRHWECTSSLNGHQGSVFKAVWAHPQFGQVIASCSADRTVIVWEEQIKEGASNASNWAARATLTDHRASVTDVKFAPAHLGLKLASAAEDGTVRLYEAAANATNLSTWSHTEEFQVPLDSNQKLSVSLSWNPSRMGNPMIAVGCSSEGKGHVAISVFQSTQTKQWVRIFHEAEGAVFDLAFSPNPGRPFDLLASSWHDHGLKVWKLTSSGVKAKLNELGEDSSVETLKKEELIVHSHDHEHDHPNQKLWRVSWSATGTVLGTSTDDNHIDLWVSNSRHEWAPSKSVSMAPSLRH